MRDDIKRAYSAYTRAINCLIQGKETEAKDELLRLQDLWQSCGISVDVNESMEKMKAEVHRLSESGIIVSHHHTPPTTSAHHNPLGSISLPAPGHAVHPRQPRSPSPPSDLTPVSAAAAAASPHPAEEEFIFSKNTELKGSDIPLAHLEDQDIYEGAMPLSTEEIQNGSILVGYNNVFYGGYAPNLSVNFASPLSLLHNKEERLTAIQEFLTSHSIDIPEIEPLTPIDLVKEIASKLNDNPELSLVEKEKLLETITKRLTQMLLNDTDVSNDYLLSTDQQISGRSYGHVGLTGGLVNSLFCNISVSDDVKHHGTISTNTLLKAGTGDCRATNTTYAAFLNIGYRELSSPKQAKTLYAKMADGMTSEAFSSCPPADHNVVLIQERDGAIIIKDAYFDHVDGVRLRDAINGTITRQTNQDKETVWGFQIPGSPPYPRQQQLKRPQPNPLFAQGIKSTPPEPKPTGSNDKPKPKPM